MTWVSYAQNGEDVRLRRAFGERTSGFYVDVGANDPTVCSITRSFYERGWHGINVEPSSGPHMRLAAERPRDLNLRVACSDHAGTRSFFEAPTGLSGLSTLSEEEAAAHRRRGIVFDEHPVAVTTLAAILALHGADRVIDFLSVDVEGHEREVLAGADFERFRPRVVIVEATRPNTTEPSHARWEHLLVERDYRLAVFDGLNRFYVRAEDAALGEVIALAPNVFDDYVPYAYKRQIDALEAELSRCREVPAALRSAISVTRACASWIARRARRR